MGFPQDRQLVCFSAAGAGFSAGCGGFGLVSSAAIIFPFFAFPKANFSIIFWLEAF